MKTKRSLRDWLWNYPNLFWELRPITFIIVYILLMIVLCQYIISSPILQKLHFEDRTVFTEGTVGEFVNLNPIFVSQNQVDKDIKELVFEKFIEVDANGEPIPAIATEWSMDEEKKVFTFTVGQGHFFSDGTELDAYDVAWTYNTAIYLAKEKGRETIGQALTDVTVEAQDSTHVVFTLPETNATFYEAIATYIVSEDQFSRLNVESIENSEISRKPLGTGPYSITTFDDSFVELTASEYYPSKPKISTMIYRVYPTFELLKVAYENNQLNAINGIGSYRSELQSIGGNININGKVLDSRTKLIYINNRNELLKSADIRKGFSYITDVEDLLQSTGIEGNIRKGPIKESSPYFNADIQYYKYDKEAADKAFADAGYTYNKVSGYYENSENKILSVKLSYLDNPTNDIIAKRLEKQWESEGVYLQLEPQDYEKMIKETIATRNYELLLYEVETTLDPDQYNLWHSIKSDYPNLNLAGYNYSRNDIILERARTTMDKDARIADYKLFQKYFMADAPVIFLYEPKYEYLIDSRVEGPDLTNIVYPYQRFNNIADWYYR
ncbi:MAG TPA: ABC transporter substrate-binding protein [Candidatus Dojkabacteria bacterium]|nr:ABC transporter substrate-binding protein [Candidatus Dojkabacteria bacterium]